MSVCVCDVMMSVRVCDVMMRRGRETKYTCQLVLV